MLQKFNAFWGEFIILILGGEMVERSELGQTGNLINAFAGASYSPVDLPLISPWGWNYRCRGSRSTLGVVRRAVPRQDPGALFWALLARSHVDHCKLVVKMGNKMSRIQKARKCQFRLEGRFLRFVFEDGYKQIFANGDFRGRMLD